jgi:hypothetical protein
MALLYCFTYESSVLVARVLLSVPWVTYIFVLFDVVADIVWTHMSFSVGLASMLVYVDPF